ncbi:MAG: endolytic transglycosylase MltG [Clostridia bacterium]|nr:endolytic transglycosylase MltG [Clostridia bacterium]
MTENKNPEQSFDELLDLISRSSDANKKNSEPKSSDNTEGLEKPAVAQESTRVSNIEVEGIENRVEVKEASDAHYTDEHASDSKREAPDEGHFTDDQGNAVKHEEHEELFAEVHFTGDESEKVKAKKKKAVKNAYRRASRRNREKRAHGSLTISILKALGYTVIVFLLAFFAVFGFSDFWPGIIPMANDMFAFVKADENIEITLQDGITTNELAELLEKNGVIDEEKVFKFYVKYKYVDDTELDEEDNLFSTVMDIFGDFCTTMFFGEDVPEDKDIKYLSGTYTLNPSMNYDQIISALTTVVYEREEVKIVIPEGYTVDQIIDLLTSNGIGRRENYIYAINEYPYKHEFVKLLEEEGYNEQRVYRLEGYLYPDTYIFYKDSDEIDVINKMLNTFSVRVWSEYYSTYKPVCEELGFSFDEMVTFASIVQAEGKNFTDFENISQVFHNRFDSADFDKMESCATVQYVLEIERLRKIREEGIYEERHDVLTAEDISYDSAYNTYMYSGFPAGAVCNPGLDAFDAALYPDMAEEVKEEFYLTNAYYFNSDLAGNIYYAQTPYQHQVNQQTAERVNEQIRNGTYVDNE